MNISLKDWELLNNPKFHFHTSDHFKRYWHGRMVISPTARDYKQTINTLHTISPRAGKNKILTWQLS